MRKADPNFTRAYLALIVDRVELSDHLIRLLSTTAALDHALVEDGATPGGGAHPGLVGAPMTTKMGTVKFGIFQCSDLRIGRQPRRRVAQDALAKGARVALKPLGGLALVELLHEGSQCVRFPTPAFVTLSIGFPTACSNCRLE